MAPSKTACVVQWQKPITVHIALSSRTNHTTVAYSIDVTALLVHRPILVRPIMSLSLSRMDLLPQENEGHHLIHRPCLLQTTIQTFPRLPACSGRLVSHSALRPCNMPRRPTISVRTACLRCRKRRAKVKSSHLSTSGRPYCHRLCPPIVFNAIAYPKTPIHDALAQKPTRQSCTNIICLF